jgi:hypothetical protein
MPGYRETVVDHIARWVTFEDIDRELRGRLTIWFSLPRNVFDAESTADAVVAMVHAALRQVGSLTAALGAEERVASDVLAELPADTAVSAIELSLHTEAGAGAARPPELDEGPGRVLMVGAERGALAPLHKQCDGLAVARSKDLTAAEADLVAHDADVLVVDAAVADAGAAMALLAKVEAGHPNVVCILVGGARPETRPETGRVRLVHEPWEPRTVAALVRRAVDVSRMRRAAERMPVVKRTPS